MNRATRNDVIAKSLFVRRAFDVALLSLGGMTVEQLAAKHPGFDYTVALADKPFSDQVEVFAALPSLQDTALDASLRNGLSETVTALTTRMKDPNLTGAVLRDTGDLLAKVATLVERREESRRERGGKMPKRELIYMMHQVTVYTPVGGAALDVGSMDLDEATYKVALAALCTTDEEIDKVINLLENPRIGSLTLRLPGF